MSLPVIFTATGPVTTSPDVLRQTLVSDVESTNPGYTANLPGSLIEDVVSTDVGALVSIDQARVDAINNVSPYGANPSVLAQLGYQFGIPQGQPTNTSALVVFTGTAAYVVAQGTLVGDGTYIYALQQATVIGSSGTSSPALVVATIPGSWAVPPGSIDIIQTSVPTGYSLSVTNPNYGIPGGPAESVQSYRSRVLTAGQATAQGFGAFISTLLMALPGVDSRLVNVLQVSAGWEIICGGGDPTEVAGAIYTGTLDLSTLNGSQTASRNVNVSIIEPPNSYNIVYVDPPAQTVDMTVTWNTDLPGFAGAQAVNQTAQPAMVSAINTIIVGQPINLLALTALFQQAVANILPAIYLSTLDFAVSINGTAVSPTAGTSLIPSDPESYFIPNTISVVQG